MSLPRQSKTISPTADYTGHVWYRHGLSHRAFASRRGRLFYHAMQPAMQASARLGGPTLEDFLLARHRLIDQRLGAAIDAGRITQVIEIAAGLSPRGWRFSQRYGDAITYIETDLPEMAARKQRMLAQIGDAHSHHYVARLDALASNGPNSLDALTAGLNPDQGVAIISEGLLNYLDRASVERLWQRIVGRLAGFPYGLYLSDLHSRQESLGAGAGLFVSALSTFVRGRVHLHYRNSDAAQDALQQAGFPHVQLHRPSDWAAQIGAIQPGADRVRVIEAEIAGHSA